jgi:nucleotide-binding universal stress UspA family protein
MSTLSNAGVLVLAEPDAHGRSAAWRGAIAARELGLPLRLLHVRSAAAGPPEPEPALQHLAAEIRSHLDMPVRLEFAQGDPHALTVQAARDAAMVVLGTRRGNPLQEFVLGTQAERLIRLCRVPVLVVKRPPLGAYRRVLVPVELGPAARPVIAAAARLSRDPRMEVLHALNTGDELGMRACELPEALVRRERQRIADRARAALQAFVAEAAPQPQEALASVAFGDAAALVLAREQSLRAELVVMGKRRRNVLADFLLGSVTRQVLARSQADVLVLPSVGLEGQGRRGDAGWRVPQLS